MNIDLTELLALTEEELRRGKKGGANMQDQKKPVAAWNVVALSQQIDAEQA